MALCGCGSPDPNAPPVLRDSKEYEQTLISVRQLTEAPFQVVQDGDTLSDDQRSDLQEANRLIDGLIAFQPDKYGPYILKGLVLRALGDSEAASRALSQGVLQAPSTPSPDDRLALARLYDLMAQIDFDKGDFSNAEKSASKAIGLAPEDPEVLVTAASVQIQLGRPKSAEPLLQKALKLSPNHPKATNLLKLVKMANG